MVKTNLENLDILHLKNPIIFGIYGSIKHATWIS